jgi:two-component system sensor kinase
MNAHLQESLCTLTAELEGFSYSVSHDLRAPLRAIDGFSRVLQSDYGEELDDEGRRLLGVVRNNAAHMGVLINGLLSYSRLGRQEMKPSLVDMTDSAQRIFAEQQAAVSERQIEITLKDLAPAWVDHKLAQQLLGNLIANAIKFTRTRDIAQIEIGGQTDGSMNTYYVKDNGVGFDMTYVDKLFGVFQRLHSEDEFEGVGIGLALTQRIVRRLGGKIWADATLAEGATFYFTLPGESESVENGTSNSRELTGITSRESS